MSDAYFRRVGAARPSHLMFTGGVGSLIDLPNFSVLVKGTDTWDYKGLAGSDYLVSERRLTDAVNRVLRRYGPKKVTELRSAPWQQGADDDPRGEAAQGVGVPVTPFPQWLRCTACNLLAGVDSDAFTLVNRNPRTPHEAKFVHDCKKVRPLAVAARFTLVCTDGHLDEFPYVRFVHRGLGCPTMPRPSLRMRDRGGNQAADVDIECRACGASRNIREAMGERGQANLPQCRGRHPHLDFFEPEGCVNKPLVMVAGASNQWFPITLTALALPETKDETARALVEKRWDDLQHIESAAEIRSLVKFPPYRYLADFDAEEIAAAVAAHKAALAGTPVSAPEQPVDLLTDEWRALTSSTLPQEDDFTLREAVVPPSLSGLFASVRQVERLREARALVGFTRLDAFDPEDPGLVTRVELSRLAREWVPATEVRGEGVFVRLDADLVANWEARVAHSEAIAAHRAAYARFRDNRRSDRLAGAYDSMAHWPGARYIALHTLSHMLIRTIALECGYSSASLAERIYTGNDDDPRTGILLYTAVPDSEGTLGGLVSLAEQPHFERIVRRAFSDALHCSSDPLCAERLPQKPFDYLHGAACHVCLFLSETTCERGNRFLDRRFLVPLDDDPDLLLTPPDLVG
ncbi:DUF1998 domain-containing protein [Yinghuangia sp. ASG 101]|uniref:DUF1998 domain-containing protein n=1 Tax=Yinghuangia sp. ASG 101 TaxID=2896848 RepID=UPI001E6397E2|nr:DUF1998 domain-containing protein [Yinghuangia sp. ASG 101]UGQ11289.1 DUF1998 domain-containing protein [Yinghuangia sp. ASG 101]